MLRIRLSRVGRKKQPFFKIVVIPRGAGTKSRNFRDEVGTHDPVNKETIIDADKARGWIAKGAQPTDTVHNLFVKYGVITGRKVEAHDKDPVEPEEKPEEKEEKQEEKKETKEEESKEEPKEEEDKEDEEEKEEPEEESKEEKEEP
ncbi:MAG: 30S ribosomal protein S16, partial [Patescibacteria group bacterium]